MCVFSSQSVLIKQELPGGLKQSPVYFMWLYDATVKVMRLLSLISNVSMQIPWASEAAKLNYKHGRTEETELHFKLYSKQFD